MGRPKPALAVGIVVLVAGFVGLLAVDAARGTLRAGAVTSTIGWFLVAFVGFLLVMASTQTRSGLSTKAFFALLLGLGLVLRLALVATEPTLSDDVYRYLWEGHLVTEGISPYSFAIDDPAGEAIAIDARELANNRSLASPYLPVAHAVFGAAALVLPSEPWTMQLIMIAFDTLAAGAISSLLGLARLPRERVLLYWLNPLVIVEVGHGAHIDALIVGLAMSGVLLSLRAWHVRSGATPAAMHPAAQLAGPALLAAAALTRPLAVLFVPILFWIWTWRQRAVWLVSFAVPILIAGAATDFGLGDSGTGVFGSARAYAESFRFNSAFYQRLEDWISGRGLDDKGWNEPVALTQLIVSVAVVIALLAIFELARRLLATDFGDERTAMRTTLRLLALPIILYVLATPVLHPWYVLLLLALVPFLAPGADEPGSQWLIIVPWLVLSALLVFSYLTYQDPEAFAERRWVNRLQWYPTLALLVASIPVMRAAYGRAPAAARP